MTSDITLQKLNRLLERCKSSSFYKNRIPDRPLASFDELKELPLTIKDDLRRHSPYGFVCVPKEELYQYHESFGTTGKPASTWLTKEDFLDLADSVNKGGINFNENDIVLIRFPYAISTVAHFVHAAAQIKKACVIPASSRTTVSPFKRIVDLMRKLDVTVLACLPLQAVLIAETAEILGYIPKKDFPSLRAIYTAGEALTPHKRKVLEDIWGVPISDNYGMTEIGAAVVNCEYGTPHPLNDKFIFELLDEDLKTEVRPGQIGNLVVTTLTRKGTPLIRYFTGDRGRIVRKDCKCGKDFSLEIRGRIQDVITIGNKKLDLWDLGNIVSSFKCHRFWVAGPFSGGIKFVAEEERSGDSISEKLVEELESKYGINICVEVVPKGTLYDRKELLSVGVVGKPKYIYSEQEMAKKDYLKSSRL